jgi:hypothetical protein
MAIGNLSRIESAFAEAAFDQSLWARALEIATEETSGFGATLLPITGRALPSAIVSHGVV